MIRKAMPFVVLVMTGCSSMPSMDSMTESMTSMFKSSDDTYASAPCDVVSSRYNSSIDEMQAKVTENWEQLQKSTFNFLPSFMGGASPNAKSAQESFVTNYKQYSATSKELKRCGIQAKPLSDSVKGVAKTMGLL